MQAVKSSLQDYHLVSQKLAKVKAALKSYVSPDSQLSILECTDGLQEDLPVKLLYPKDDNRAPTILFCMPEDYLVLKVFLYIQYPENPKILYKISLSFFDNKDDSDHVLQLLANVRDGASNAAQVAPPVQHLSVANID